MSEKQEIALMRRLAAGDQQAFTVLYEQYRGVSYSFVLSLVKDSSIAKDIVHDVFVKLWLKRESLANTGRREGGWRKPRYRHADR